LKVLRENDLPVIMISLVLNLRLSDRALHRSSPICKVIFYNQVFSANSPSATRLEEWGRGN